MTKKQWEQLIQEFEKSQMKQVDFCKMKGVKVGTFSSRRTHYDNFIKDSELKNNKKVKETNFNYNNDNGPFSKLGVINTCESSNNVQYYQTNSMSIRFSNISIQFEAAPNPQWFAQLVIELEKNKNQEELSRKFSLNGNNFS